MKLLKFILLGLSFFTGPKCFSSAGYQTIYFDTGAYHKSASIISLRFEIPREEGINPQKFKFIPNDLALQLDWKKAKSQDIPKRKFWVATVQWPEQYVAFSGSFFYDFTNFPSTVLQQVRIFYSATFPAKDNYLGGTSYKAITLKPNSAGKPGLIAENTSHSEDVKIDFFDAKWAKNVLYIAFAKAVYF